MSNTTPTFHTSKDKEWADFEGKTIPYSRTTSFERLREKSLASLFKKAQAACTQLKEFKADAEKEAMQLYTAGMEKLGANAKATKGNFTEYNFDKSCYLEVKMQDRIAFDNMAMQAAKQKHDEWLKTVILKGVDDEDGALADMVNDAYTNESGDFDNKRVDRLLSKKNRYKGEKHRLFHEGCDLIISAKSIQSSKRYIRFFIRQDDGSYQNLALNFSSI